MKKRGFCLLFALLLLLGACAPTSDAKVEQSFALYFPTETGELKTKAVSLQTQTLEEIISVYVQTLPPEGAKGAIPNGWMLHDVQQEETTAVVAFRGKAYSQIETYLAAACLVKTLSQLEGISEIRMFAPGLDEEIELSAEDIVLKDTAMLPQKESIVLYLPDGRQRYLIKQTKTVEAMNETDKPRYIIERLLEASSEDACIPLETRLLSITVENGICTVNLSSAFVQNMKPNFAQERLAVYSIVNSLTEIPEITTVDIWIEGAPLEKLTFMHVPNALERNERIIFNASSDVQDATIFVSHDGESLVALPILLRTQEESSFEELLLSALIAFGGESGARACVPAGTKLLSLRMEGSACIIDLTGDFLSKDRTPQEEQLAVRSIVATMCAIDGITSVEILVEGLEPIYRNSALQDIRQPEAHWYAEN